MRRSLERVFEGATPLVARLSTEAPFASDARLLARAREILRQLSDAEKIAVINAHPRIGESPDRVRARSLASFREQGYDRATTPPEVSRELARLNAEYEGRFGFRFVVFVNRRPQADLVPVLHERLQHSRAEEIATALDEILAIAADRLQGGGGGGA